MAIYQLGENTPSIDPSAYVAENATVIGKVSVGADSSIWFNVLVRGDNDRITIGNQCNIQDGAVLHADPGFPLAIAGQVSIGHQAMVHGCTIGENSLIGIQAIILNGAKIGKNCLVGAGALITEGKEFPDNSLILGTPARVVRTLDAKDIQKLQAIANSYVERAGVFKHQLKRMD